MKGFGFSTSLEIISRPMVVIGYNLPRLERWVSSSRNIKVSDAHFTDTWYIMGIDYDSRISSTHFCIYLCLGLLSKIFLDFF